MSPTLGLVALVSLQLATMPKLLGQMRGPGQHQQRRPLWPCCLGRPASPRVGTQ
ncbi:hypothetical protein I79_026245 [Cricetulus griseus]|uniref:Uncharacterized protein n=1 Tax=Cricetulus griseus TaxID=10029 RepID=G3IQC7_CRIGR|nr:hypothetical protein I79_026245 [Cricetulus griseus]